MHLAWFCIWCFCSCNCLFFSCNCFCKQQIIVWSDLTSVAGTVPVAAHLVATGQYHQFSLVHSPNSSTWQSSQIYQWSSGFKLDAHNTTALLEHLLPRHVFWFRFLYLWIRIECGLGSYLIWDNRLQILASRLLS